jgi:V-type H+-transporting ATPase subunit E
MIKLLEPELYLKVKKEDLDLVRRLIPECEREFVEIMKREIKEEVEKEYATKLIILEGEFLTPEDGGECGGVILYSKDRKIVCGNTLLARLQLCFEELLPDIRNQLFPAPIKK